MYNSFWREKKKLNSEIISFKGGKKKKKEKNPELLYT